MPKHEYFEKLCSLAPLGKISPEELAELEQHLRHCDSCRAVRADFESIAGALVFRAPIQQQPARRFLGIFSSRDKSEERFLAKARERGILPPEREVSSGQPGSVWGPLLRHYRLALVSFLLLFVVGVLAYHMRESNARIAAGTKENVQLHSENKALREHVAELSTILSDAEQVEAELATTRREYSAAQSHVHELKQQLERVSTDAESLQASVDLEKNSKSVLQQELQQAQERVAELAGELDRLRGRQRAEATLLTAQRAEIDAFSDRQKENQQRLDRAEWLLMADRDIRDLMAARNLHIIDVFDADSGGRRKPPFGRIFYTEGKLLQTAVKGSRKANVVLAVSDLDTAARVR